MMVMETAYLIHDYLSAHVSMLLKKRKGCTGVTVLSSQTVWWLPKVTRSDM
jgi:hypothetical protein